MRGESERSPGRPGKPTSRVAPDTSLTCSAAEAVLATLPVEFHLAGGEVVVLAVGLAHEVQVVDRRRMRCRLHGGETWVRDRRRRQTRALARVVGAVAVDVRLPERL